MAGITSFGVYIPIYRLDRDEIAQMWGTRSIGGQKAVAGYDEDAVTMAVAAARQCLTHHQFQPDGLYFATTTAPYQKSKAQPLLPVPSKWAHIPSRPTLPIPCGQAQPR